MSIPVRLTFEVEADSFQALYEKAWERAREFFGDKLRLSCFQGIDVEPLLVIRGGENVRLYRARVWVEDTASEPPRAVWLGGPKA